MTILRTATENDADNILRMIQLLADYEREPNAVKATRSDIIRYGFGENKVFDCILAENNGEVVGFALFFATFSTWEGRPGVYLEDLFVLPECRGSGIGKALMARVAAHGVERGATRMGWQVLDWNEPAIEFYKSIGARDLEEWRTYRLEGKELELLARLAVL